MMLDDEALEPLDVVRQCVDVEHARIIRAALKVRTGLCMFIVVLCVVGLTSADCDRTVPLYTARVGCVLSGS